MWPPPPPRATTPFPPPPPSSGRIYFGRLIISYKAIFYSMKYNYKCQFIRLIIFYSTGHGKSLTKEIRFISKTQHVGLQNINPHNIIKKISLSNHSTVVPAMGGHPWDQEKVSVHDRWPLIRGTGWVGLRQTHYTVHNSIMH